VDREGKGHRPKNGLCAKTFVQQRVHKAAFLFITSKAPVTLHLSSDKTVTYVAGHFERTVQTLAYVCAALVGGQPL